MGVVSVGIIICIPLGLISGYYRVKVDFIIHEARRTDRYGHFYFTSNPGVSSDLIQLLRFDKRPGDLGRELIKVGPIVWKFPPSDD